MKKCIKCGSPASSNNENWCRYCGGQLVEVPTIKCRNCGATVDPDTKICQQCGTNANSMLSTPRTADRSKSHHRESIRSEKEDERRLLTIAITITAIVCLVSTISLCAVLFLKSNDKQQVKTEITETDIPKTGISNTETVVEDNTSQKDTTTLSGLRDYDSDNDDWYRIRKSKNDPSTQVGAYKTVEKALYYADIYCPQGYTLYDKDFNVIR